MGVRKPVQKKKAVRKTPPPPERPALQVPPVRAEFTSRPPTWGVLIDPGRRQRERPRGDSRRPPRNPDGRGIARSADRRAARRSARRRALHRTGHVGPRPAAGQAPGEDRQRKPGCDARFPALGPVGVPHRADGAGHRKPARRFARRRRARSGSGHALLAGVRRSVGPIPGRLRHGRRRPRSAAGFRTRAAGSPRHRLVPRSVPRARLRARGHRADRDRPADGDPRRGLGLSARARRVERARGAQRPPLGTSQLADGAARSTSARAIRTG